MKTPRELLLARHQAAPKLDAICREVVATECAAQDRNPAEVPAGLLARLWREAIWPCRRFWTGLAFVWVLLIVVNLAQRDDSGTVIAESNRAAEILILVRNQERILNETLFDRSQAADAIPPRSSAPRPRSEASKPTAV
jgi:hypothetical protein